MTDQTFYPEPNPHNTPDPVLSEYVYRQLLELQASLDSIVQDLDERLKALEP